jgi:ATP-dependent DNA ligase
MAGELILKAVEFGKTSAAFRKQHKDEEALYEAGWHVQPKYDGVFGMACIRERLMESRMLSRTGEDYTLQCQHILQALWSRFTRVRGPGWHGAVVLGEVWHPELPQRTISGDFRRHHPAPHLVFVANDLLSMADDGLGEATRCAYYDRHADLLADFQHGVPGVQVVSNVHVLVGGGKHTLLDTARAYVQRGGYDGLILRDPLAGYSRGLAKNGEIIKVKPSLTLDLLVVGIEEGLGKHAGRLGSVTVEYRGVQTKVGTGFSDADRMAFWPATGNVGIIGRIVEVEAMGLTDAGALREPRFKDLRHDKAKPDA